MRIALISAPWYPVPPDGYGGIERVVFLLAEGLHERGHEVTVIGRQGSHGAFEVLSLAPASWTADLGTRDHMARETAYLRRAYDVVCRRPFDIVHDHTGHAGIILAAEVPSSSIAFATLHGDLTEADAELLTQVEDRVNLIAISRAQQSQVAAVRWNGMVHNAVDVSDLEFSADKDDYLVTLARISPTKGQDIAIDVAKRTGHPLVLAGKIGEGEDRYFKERIEPAIGKGVRWIENARGKEKAALLAKARGMLFPLQWVEPFGLAMVEAMASGTPVIAFPNGAAAEIVEPGTTGFLAHDVEEMAEAVGRLNELDPQRCAHRARERFSSQRMAEQYETLYETAVLSRR